MLTANVEHAYGHTIPLICWWFHDVKIIIVIVLILPIILLASQDFINCLRLDCCTAIFFRAYTYINEEDCIPAVEKLVFVRWLIEREL